MTRNRYQREAGVPMVVEFQKREYGKQHLHRLHGEDQIMVHPVLLCLIALDYQTIVILSEYQYLGQPIVVSGLVVEHLSTILSEGEPLETVRLLLLVT